MAEELKPSKFETLAHVADLCVQKGVRDVIISPGSRSAPLTVSFARQPDLRGRVVPDERAAGFIALGLAQQTGRPVGLVCTSGTAALNYGPAVAEAYYQRLPLLIFTADRPPEWIDQQDGQTIRQQNLYGAHCRGSFNLPVDLSHPDARWQAERIISEAITLAIGPAPGPVQVNVPLREPLYAPPDQVAHPRTKPKAIELLPGETTLPGSVWEKLLPVWAQSRKKLIVGGTYDTTPAGLAALRNDPTVAIIADLTANIHQTAGPVAHWETVLESQSAGVRKALAPELLVTFGGPVVSKTLKLFLRHYKPAYHWHVDPAGQIIDTFQSLTQVIPLKASSFFETLTQRIDRSNQPVAAGYGHTWSSLAEKGQRRLSSALADSPFNEFQAAADCLQALPEPSRLQLSNSMPVRYANLLGLAGRDIRVNSNRGTSGIDGCLSTAVGAAWATDQITTLITGDLAFFYDRNGLWHNHVPANLRVIILNNHGGGIFKLIDGPGRLSGPELEEYFFTPQPLTAKNTAADYHCDYFYCNDRSTLRRQLPEFFTRRSRPTILEIETDSAVNTTVYRQVKAALADLTIEE